jgi:acetyltransferase-like isoleucine patch superfamily enzyme
VFFDKKNEIYPNVNVGLNVQLEDFIVLGKPPKGKKSGELTLSIGNNPIIRNGAIIYAGSEIGDYFVAEEHVVVYPHVKIGDNVKIGSCSIVGVPIEDSQERYTIIGDNAVIRSGTVIYSETKIGKNLNCGHNVIIREFTRIGDNSQIGTLSQIEGYAEIGNWVKLHTNVHIGQYSKIEDHVFIAPGTVLTNTLHPLCPQVKKCIEGPIIRSHVKIGTNVTIAPRVEIGENSLIGAATNVTNDVPANSVVVGNPGKVIKTIHDLKCPFNFVEKPYSPEYKNMT